MTLKDNLLWISYMFTTRHLHGQDGEHHQKPHKVIHQPSTFHYLYKFMVYKGKIHSYSPICGYALW